ncbi:MAG: carboxypeptidase regulatory-like domain-containing protein [Planctomycetes bacterium]|nr:carboxypeptidase regulatory-like domain-containing protein [Planctomycetota bacterium]
MNSKSLLVVALVAVFGFGLWLALAGGGDVAPDTPAAGDVATTAGSVPAANAATADHSGPAPSQPPASEATTNERSVAPTSAPADAREITVRGRLVDRHGVPRADAEVRLLTWLAERGGELLEGVPPAPLDDERFANAPKKKTGTDGQFEFTVGKDRAGRVSLTQSDLVFAGADPAFSGRRGNADLGDIKTLRSSSVAGVVRGPSGQPLADVVVAASFGGLFLGRSQMRTDGDGRFKLDGLRAGTTHLRTASAKFQPVLREVEIGEEEDKTGVDLMLAEGAAIAGQVVDDRGIGVAGLKVGAKRRFERAGVTTEQFTPDEATETDAQGFFVLSGLQGERASVRAWGAGHTPAVERNVAVGTGNLLLRVERHGSIAGVLTGVDGKPIAGSRVRATTRPTGGRDETEIVIDAHDDLDMPLPGRGPQARTEADGTFLIEGVAPGNIVVSARGSSHRPVERTGVVVTPAQVTSGIALTADLGATARVQVVDDAGKPVADARVEIRQQQQPDHPEGGMNFRARSLAIEDEGDGPRLLDGPPVFGKGTTNADGIVEIGGLPAGGATVEATHETMAEARPLDIVLPRAGVTEASVALRRPGFAELTITAPAGAAVAGTRWVVHGPIGVGEAERDRPGSAPAEGIIRVGPLPAGDYWAELRMEPKPRSFGGGMAFTTGEARGLQQTRQRFQVPAGETVAVALRKPVLTRVHGVVLGPDGPASGIVVELERQAPPGAEPGGDLPDPFGGPTTRTGADGTFEMLEVEAGSYRLRWGKPDQIVKASEPIDVMPDQAELRRELQLRTGKLRVQAWSLAESDSIEGAEVRLTEGSGAGNAPRRAERRVMMVSMTMNNDGGESTTMTMGDQRAKTDANGVAEIADVPPGTYTVRITHDKHVAKELVAQVIVEGQTTDAGRVEMVAAGRLRARVLGPDGKPAGMGMVFCQRAGTSGEPQREPAMSGQATFNGLEPGRYLVKAQELMIGPGAGAPKFGPEVEVEVTAGRSPATVEVSLPAK